MVNNTLGFNEVRIAATNRWEGIHRHLGVTLKSLSPAKHAPCPACGGRDRFRVFPDYAETGRWICSGGGNQQMGDGFSLLGHVFGWSPQEQLKAVADYLGLSRATNADREQLRQQAEKRAEQIRKSALQKTEQARLDCLMLDNLMALEDAIGRRKRAQSRAPYAYLKPDDAEINAAYQLNKAVLEVYANG